MVSTSWDIPSRKSFHVRACTWAQFKVINSSKILWVFNSHLSLERAVIEKELALIQQEILRKVSLEPLILMGDFNTVQLPQTIMADFINSKNVAQKYKNNNLGSYKDYTIDYILLKNILKNAVELYAVVDYEQGYTENNITPSDHRPVYVDIVL